MFVRGGESILCAASIEQARIVYRFVLAELEPKGGFKFQDSANKIGIRHVPTNTRLRVISSSGKRAMGLGVGNPWIVADEPGAWDVNNGAVMFDAIMTSLGKPGQSTRAIFIGTLAPAMNGWWHGLVKSGSRGSTYVQALQGDPDKWDRWPEVRRVNPLTAVDPKFRRKLLEERDAALGDSRLKARFLSYRMNVPTVDEAEVLLTADDWSRVRARPVPPREHAPIVGIDLGAGRSWSSACAIFPNGRTEAIAVAPGVPSLDMQEKRDIVPAGTYKRLADRGVLRCAEGLRVPPASMLVDWIRELWGIPYAVICDRFRLDDLRDCSLPCPLESRVSRWSESGHDIRALRKSARDGPLSCEKASDPLILWSLTAAMVKNDDAGGTRLVKRDPSNNSARDDTAAAMVLAAGAAVRRPAPQPGRQRFRIVG